jgi:hypothetical protein
VHTLLGGGAKIGTCIFFSSSKNVLNEWRKVNKVKYHQRTPKTENLPQRRTATNIDQPFGGPYPVYSLSGYSWGIPGSADVLTALPLYSLIFRKEFQNMPPLVIGVVPNTNRRKVIYPSVTCAVRPLCSQPGSFNKRCETVYRSTSTRSHSSQMTCFFRES